MRRIAGIIALGLLGGCSLVEPPPPATPPPAPIESLQGVEWLLSHGPVAIPEDSELTAHFESDRVSGSAGCNHYFASFTSDAPGRIAIGPAGATRRFCEPPERMDLEMAFLAALSEVRAYRNGEAGLELLAADGETVLLHFRR